MAEFYVTFNREEVRYLGVIVAHQRPEQLKYSSYESLRDAMEALGNRWELKGEIADPEQQFERTSEWLERMSAEKALKPADKPILDFLTSAGGGADVAWGEDY